MNKIGCRIKGKRPIIKICVPIGPVCFHSSIFRYDLLIINPDIGQKGNSSIHNIFFHWDSQSIHTKHLKPSYCAPYSLYSTEWFAYYYDKDHEKSKSLEHVELSCSAHFFSLCSAKGECLKGAWWKLQCWKMQQLVKFLVI